MAFELKVNERVGDGITRNVKNQIEKALRYLGAKGEPVVKNPPAASASEKGASQKDAIAEVRRCFKKVRAALRLVREDLGDDLYHEENWSFRDAARPLTQVRDAVVLVETAEQLRPQLVQAVGPGAFAKIHAALIAHRQEVGRLVLDEGRAFANVADAAGRALARLSEWKLQRDGWAAVETGLRHVYRQGHRALALAAESPSVANLHEWRKQTKYLWHQLQLLEARWTDTEKDLVDHTHQLATFLGEDHDLAVLRETLAADPLAYGGHRILKGVFAVIDRRRSELERQAFALGGEIYQDSPRVFTARIEALMRSKEAA
jgi:CHAD domain-containing protein